VQLAHLGLPTVRPQAWGEQSARPAARAPAPPSAFRGSPRCRGCQAPAPRRPTNGSHLLRLTLAADWRRPSHRRPSPQNHALGGSFARWAAMRAGLAMGGKPRSPTAPARLALPPISSAGRRACVCIRASTTTQIPVRKNMMARPTTRRRH
jgi:hypothetical protein